jgi:hypothetical protein
MIWQEKISVLRSMDPSTPTIAMFFEAPSPAAEENIHQLLSSLPEIEGLEEFLRTCDGLVAGVTWLGGVERGVRNLLEMNKREPWMDGWLPKTHTRVGELAGGDAILLAPGGRVEFLWSREDTSRFVANSLSEFIDQVFLGPRYTEVLGAAPDDWYELIEAQGWGR